MRILRNDDTFFALEGDAAAWLDGGAHVKVVTSIGDPVEMTADELRFFAHALLRFATKLDAELNEG